MSTLEQRITENAQVKNRILLQLYKPDLPWVSASTLIGNELPYQAWWALGEMRATKWIERQETSHKIFNYRLTEYGVHLCDFGLVIQNAGAAGIHLVPQHSGDTITNLEAMVDRTNERLCECGATLGEHSHIGWHCPSNHTKRFREYEPDDARYEEGVTDSDTAREMFRDQGVKQ